MKCNRQDGSMQRQFLKSARARLCARCAHGLVGLLVVGVTCLACAQVGPTPNRRHELRKDAASALPAAAPAAAPAPVAPPVEPALVLAEPPAPIQAPTHPPKVSWNGKELTVDADNSSLMEILMAVRTKTGALVDVPDSVSNERVAVHIGPAPIRDVLEALLYGTSFDYALQATDDGAGLRSLVLTTRAGKDDEPAVAVADHPLPPGVHKMKGNGPSGKTTFQAAAEAALAEHASAEKPSTADSASPAEAAEPEKDPAAAGPESASNGSQDASTAPAAQANSNPALTSDSSSPSAHAGTAANSGESTSGDSPAAHSTR